MCYFGNQKKRDEQGEEQLIVGCFHGFLDLLHRLLPSLSILCGWIKISKQSPFRVLHRKPPPHTLSEGHGEMCFHSFSFFSCFSCFFLFVVDAGEEKRPKMLLLCRLPRHERDGGKLFSFIYLHRRLFLLDSHSRLRSIHKNLLATPFASPHSKFFACVRSASGLGMNENLFSFAPAQWALKRKIHVSLLLSPTWKAEKSEELATPSSPHSLRHYRSLASYALAHRWHHEEKIKRQICQPWPRHCETFSSFSLRPKSFFSRDSKSKSRCSSSKLISWRISCRLKREMK